ncbi:MAG: hypothetical protein PHE36_03630 [Novosphingobium sp.]|nr:hypothetical protein [Novosphingobium sp.]
MAMTALAAAGTAFPAAAQVDDARMRKVEAEVRALQRKVFPGGDGRFFADGSAAGTSQSATGLPPATTAMTDVLARLDALEARLASLTAQVENNTNALARLTGRVAALEPAPAPAPAPPTGAIGSPPAAGAGNAANAADANLSAMSGGASAAARPSAPAAPAPAKPAPPSAERLERVKAIAKPDTGDAGEDEYTYGFRLWEAKLYPEAQQQLRLFVDKYPKHNRISYGRNLLGRAYLDDGKPKEAAPWFVKNYDDDMNGARAPDSLLYLAEAMIEIKDTSRACIALAKFGEAYPALATGRLQSQYEADRTKVKCK